VLLSLRLGRNATMRCCADFSPHPLKREDSIVRSGFQDLAWHKLARWAETLRAALPHAVPWSNHPGAIAISKSSTLGSDLADSLYSELFGLKSGVVSAFRRWLPIPGALAAFMLRSTLAQRTSIIIGEQHRETSLETIDMPATAPPSPAASWKN